ncbi:MAG TPA: hypothetical protein VFE71_04240, partial [Bacteroidales bacterium]|nr:hypothetical protein [Bacteroidales bacterium]
MVIPVNVEGIPEELKALKNWLLWKYEDRTDSKGNIKKTKVPYQISGKKADSMNPGTWGELDKVLKTYERFPDQYNGIGFIFSENSGIMGLDFDHIRDPKSGKWDENALEEIKSLNSYAELSPSGTGAHVICIAEIPGKRRRAGPREMYETGRYFTVTGDYIEGTAQNVNQSQEAVNGLYNKWFPSVNKQVANKKKSPELSDEDVLNLCRNAKNAEKFNSLYAGNIKGFASQSEADLSLCSIMAFYTQNKEQLNKLFCESKLFRDKWDREDYGAKTLEKAISGLTEVYDPEKKGKDKSSEGKPEKITVPFDVVADHILKNHHIFSMRDNRQIYLYKDGVYKNEGTEAILDTEIRNVHNTFFVKYWNSINPGFPLPHIKKATTKYVSEVLAYIRAYTHITRDSIEEDQAKYINFKNLLFNLDTWKTEDHSPE